MARPLIGAVGLVSGELALPLIHLAAVVCPWGLMPHMKLITQTEL